MAERKLTVKQRKFVKAIAAGKSGTEAAIKAGYSKKSARTLASQTLTNRNVREAVEAEVDAAAKKAGLSPEWVYESLKRLHDFNSRQTITEEGEEKMINAPVALEAAKTAGKFMRMGERKTDPKDESILNLSESLREGINAWNKEHGIGQDRD